MKNNYQKGFSFMALIAAIAAFFGIASHVAPMANPIASTTNMEMVATTTTQLNNSGVKGNGYAGISGGAQKGMNSDWKTYTDSNYNYSLEYPSDFAVVSDVGTPAQQEQMFGSYMGICTNNNYNKPGEIKICYTGNSNAESFDRASFVLIPNISTSTEDCQRIQAKDYGQFAQFQKIINGVTFYEVKTGDAGLSHHESIDSFSTYHSGVCYEISLNIESHASGSSTENENSPQFQILVSTLTQKLGSILSSFKFTDLNNQATSISPSITVTSPNGGETWTIGSTHNITWSTPDTSTPITIQVVLYIPPCTTGACPALSARPYMITQNINPNLGSYPWLVNYNIAYSDGASFNPNSSMNIPAGKYIIQVCQLNSCDSSNNYFTITN